MNIIFLLSVCFMFLFPDREDAERGTDKDRDRIVVSPDSLSLQRLYTLNVNDLLWYCEDCESKRNTLLQLMGDAGRFGLPAYRTDAFSNGNFSSDEALVQADQKLSELAIAFCMDLYSGKNMEQWISYDALSDQFRAVDENKIYKGIVAARDSAELSGFIHSLEPQTTEYRLLKAALNADSVSRQQRVQLSTSMNYYRWIHHFQFDSFILINIPAARLKFLKSNDAALEMLAVVGKTSNRTPRFASYCKEVTLYPYWNVPRSILEKELLEKLRKNPAYLERQNMEIIDRNGQVVSAASIDWSSVSKANFPYRLRAKPGCSNALGVLKFTMENPFDVYLHDTNFKDAFSSNKRFLSHGCVRIERPIDLANALLENQVDESYLNACYKDEKPEVKAIKNPVPVFIVYMCADASQGDSVRYYKDVYGLLN